MAEKKRNRKIIGPGGGLSILALLAIVFTAVSVPVMTLPAEGKTQCPIPLKESNAMKPTKPNEAPPAGVRPPIDLVLPAKTETATFAMG